MFIVKNRGLEGQNENTFVFMLIYENDKSTMIENVNYLMHQIDKKEPDIIIAGSQSGTTPRAFYNVKQIPLEQISFLIGINPDAVILNVNADDDLAYIMRSIQTIESVGRCKVIAIVVFPFVYNNGWGIIRDKKVHICDKEQKNIVGVMEQELNKKVLLLDNSETVERLLELCLDFFGEKSCE